MTTTNKIDHIGIAVKDLEKAANLYCSLLNLKEIHRETLMVEHINLRFLAPISKEDPSPAIELISPAKGDSAVARFIDNRGEGLHHLCYGVDDLDKSIKSFEEDGAMLLKGYPRKGSNGKIVAFFHPKTTNGVLIELSYDLKPIEP